MTLTEGRKFCLETLSAGAFTGPELSHQAKAAGVCKMVRGINEWADKFLPWLRDNGLAERTGQRREAANIHRITEKGRHLLARGE